jgi:hypothetical protein
VHQPGAEPLQQLALTEHDLGLVADALRQVVEALRGLAEPDEVEEQLRTAREQRAADRESGGERQRSDRDVYGERAFPSAVPIIAAQALSSSAPITRRVPFSARP